MSKELTIRSCIIPRRVKSRATCTIFPTSGAAYVMVPTKADDVLPSFNSAQRPKSMTLTIGRSDLSSNMQLDSFKSRCCVPHKNTNGGRSWGSWHISMNYSPGQRIKDDRSKYCRCLDRRTFPIFLFFVKQSIPRHAMSCHAMPPSPSPTRPLLWD